MTNPMYPEIKIPFTPEELKEAEEVWGCDHACAAMSVLLGIPLSRMREHVELLEFAAKGHMTEKMIVLSANMAGFRLNERGKCGFPYNGIARIGFDGPWLSPGEGRRWSERRSRYVAVWHLQRSPGARKTVVYDCSSGLVDVHQWSNVVIPKLAEQVDKAYGTWHMVRSWEACPL